MSMIFASILAAAVVSLIVANLLAEAFGRYGFPLPPNARRIGCIDGLRGYLALAVMVTHFSIWINITRFAGTWSSPSIDFLNQLGTGGVSLFFMTTGLVFYPTILKGMRATSWVDIYIRRFFRIIPLVAFSVMIVTAIIVARTQVVPNYRMIAPILIWVSSWGEPPILGYYGAGRINAYVLWSLTYEWFFYFLMLPASALVIDILRHYRLPTYILPISLLIGTILIRIVIGVLGFKAGPLKYLTLFPIGMLAFELQSRARISAALSSPAVAAIAITALLSVMMLTRDPYTVSLPVYAFFFACVACGNSFGGLLRLRSALILGECSFSIYVLHGILLNILFIDFGPIFRNLPTERLPLLLIMAMPAAVILTSATYLLIERPAMRFGRSYSRRFASRGASAAIPSGAN